MNILWVLEDALRPAHMGCYGYEKPTTPVCDRLAAEGVLFETCIATASHTLPPIVSMLTGQWAATHGIVSPSRFAQWKFDNLWKDRRTPLDVLRGQNMLVDGEMVTRWAPLGFDRDTPSDSIGEYFEKNRDRSWFFYAEPYPTHLPYNPPDALFKQFLGDIEPGAATMERMEVVRSYLIVHPSDSTSKLEAGEDDPLPDDETDEAHRRTAGTVDLRPEDEPAVKALYDGEVRVFDDLVGNWVTRLEQLGILDDTLIIITADHGEELMERGHVGHCSCNLHGTLYDESIRVPLIMRWPRGLPAGRRIEQQVSQVDLMPTLFDILDLKPPPDMPFEGQTLMPLIRDETRDFRPFSFCETTPAGWQALSTDDRQMWAVRSNRWKLIAYTNVRRESWAIELFDLHADPGETRNLFGQNEEAVDMLMPALQDYITKADRFEAQNPGTATAR